MTTGSSIEPIPLDFSIPAQTGVRHVRLNASRTVAWITDGAGDAECVRACSSADTESILKAARRTSLVTVWYCGNGDHANDWDMLGSYEYPANGERAEVLIVTERSIYDGPDHLGVVDRESARALFQEELGVDDIRRLVSARVPKMRLGAFVALKWLPYADEIRESTSMWQVGPDGEKIMAKSYRFDGRKTAKIIDEARRYGACVWGFENPTELVYTDAHGIVFNAEPTLPQPPRLRLVY